MLCPDHKLLVQGTDIYCSYKYFRSSSKFSRKGFHFHCTLALQLSTPIEENLAKKHPANKIKMEKLMNLIRFEKG